MLSYLLTRNTSSANTGNNDSKKATAALGWTVKEMNNRYKLMSKVGVRNIDGYNKKHTLKCPI